MINNLSRDIFSGIFSDILNSAYNGIIIFNRGGILVYCNKVAEKILRLSGKEVIGRHAKDVISQELWNDLQEIIKTGQPQIGKKITYEDRTVIANRSPIITNGEIIGVISIFQDISEYEKVVTELEVYKNINKKLDAIIESSFDGLYITDGNANTLRVNKAYERISGLKREDLLGKNMKELVKSGIINQSASLEVLKRREPVSMTQEITTNNKKKKVIVTGNPVFDEKTNEIIMVVTNVRDITEIEELRHELEQKRDLSEKYLSELTELKLDLDANDGIIVRSEKMKSILKIACKIAQVDSPVLITGESGAGKSKLASYIHRHSRRKDGPFLKINCGALPETLIESELFGYEKGAFTGAKIEGKPGLFEAAQGGTIFLDEIGALPLHLQVKLLGVLEDKEVIRIGDTKPRKIDARIIAATNCDLKELVKENKFRSDLFYRLDVVAIEIPPLRERKEDILPLIFHFLTLYNKLYHMNKSFSSEAIDCLLSYHYPGNVRELENLVERLVIVGKDDLISLEDIPRHVFEPNYQSPLNTRETKENDKLRASIAVYEAKILEEALKKYGTTYKMAKALGINQSTVVRKLKKYGIGNRFDARAH